MVLTSYLFLTFCCKLFKSIVEKNSLLETKLWQVSHKNMPDNNFKGILLHANVQFHWSYIFQWSVFKFSPSSLVQSWHVVRKRIWKRRINVVWSKSPKLNVFALPFVDVLHIQTKIMDYVHQIPIHGTWLKSSGK